MDENRHLEPERARRNHAWRRLVIVLGCLVLLWMADSLHRGQRADDALERAGYLERTTMRNLWPRRCGLLDYEGVFWGHGPHAPEAQGYVCVRWFTAPHIERVSFDEPLGLDSHG